MAIDKARINQLTWDLMLLKGWLFGWKTGNIIKYFSHKILGYEEWDYIVLRDKCVAAGLQRMPPNWAIHMNPGIWFAHVCPSFVEAYLNRENQEDAHAFKLASIPWKEYRYDEPRPVNVDKAWCKAYNSCRTAVRTYRAVGQGMAYRRIRGNAKHAWDVVK